MLQKYLELLKKATSSMGNLGHSGAGFPEYAQAVGYEFLVLGLGLLYLAVVVAIIAIPILFIRKVFIKNSFGSKKWKEYIRIKDEFYAFCSTYTRMIKDLLSLNTEESIAEKLRELYDFLKKNSEFTISEFEDEGFDINYAAKKVKKDGEDYLESLLPDFEPYQEDFKPGNFYGKLMHSYCPSSYREKLRNIIPTQSDFSREYTKHIATLVVFCLFSILIYLMLLIPFILVFF